MIRNIIIWFFKKCWSYNFKSNKSAETGSGEALGDAEGNNLKDADDESEDDDDDDPGGIIVIFDQ